MFIVKFMQENYHSGDITFLLFNYWDKYMNKTVYSWLLNHFNFLTTITSDREIDWDHYCINFMMIHAFGVMLSHYLCDKGRVPSQIVVFLIVLNKKSWLIPICKQACAKDNLFSNSENCAHKIKVVSNILYIRTIIHVIT